jgi:hypothetical protein
MEKSFNDRAAAPQSFMNDGESFMNDGESFMNEKKIQRWVNDHVDHS